MRCCKIIDKPVVKNGLTAGFVRLKASPFTTHNNSSDSMPAKMPAMLSKRIKAELTIFNGMLVITSTTGWKISALAGSNGTIKKRTAKIKEI